MKKKHLAALFLTLAMLFSTVPSLAYSSGSLIAQKRTYSAAFTDTKGTWCDSYVKACYESGLMDGTSTSKFSPKSQLTCAQIMAVTARLHELLNGGDGKFRAAAAGESWYAPYEEYLETLAKTNDAMADALFYVTDIPYEPCSREDFVWLLAAALPASALTAINAITSLPDAYGDSDILAFYNAGILTGVNDYGTFSGTDPLNRGQASAMLARIVDPSLRVKFTPKAFSYAKELLGLDADTTVLTIDGYAVSAELYAYALSGYIFSYEMDASYSYYDTYSQYLDEYYEDENYDLYDTFADFLLAVHNIDVSQESSVQWNKADKAGLTPAQKVTLDTLGDVKEIAMLFTHASSYPLTAAQKTDNAASLTDLRAAFYGFSDSFLSLMAEGQALTDNMTAKYAPAASQMNDFLAQYNYFYGRCLAIGYDTGSESYYGRTKAEAQQLMQSVRQKAAGHLDDTDYFSYLCWKYADDYYEESSLISVDALTGTNRSDLKNLAVGSLSALLYEDAGTTGTGEILLFLKDDPSADESVQSTIGSIPAQAQLSAWAENAVVTTTAAYDKFSVAAIAAKFDQILASGLTPLAL